MVFQLKNNFGKENESIATAFGLMSYVVSFLIFFWFDLFYDTEHLVAAMSGLVLAWCLCLLLMVVFRTRKFTQYWWVLPSILIVFWRVFETMFAIVSWEIRGFAP